MGKNRNPKDLSDMERDILGAAAVAQMEADAAAETTQEVTDTPAAETAPAAEPVAEEAAPVAETAPVVEAAPVVEETPAPVVEEKGVEDSAPKAAEPASAPQVQAAPKAAPAPAAAPVKPVVAGAEFGAIGRRVMSILNTYIEQMAPRRPVSDSKIVEQQRLLFEALTKTINDSGDDFEKLLKAVFALFEEHRNGVFHETRVFRGTENLPMSFEDRAAFLRLINLFKLVANPQSRKIALKQVDLHASLQYAITEQGKNKLLSFFGV